MDSVAIENAEDWLGLRHLFVVNQLLDSRTSFFKKKTEPFWWSIKNRTILAVFGCWFSQQLGLHLLLCT
jgi:hypothetical protein